MEDVIHSDLVRLREIIPPEIWKIVAGKLHKNDKQDSLEKLINSSPFFQNLLASQRTTYLLEKVFQIVTSTVWKKEGLHGLPVSDILQCRAACSSWNTSIDKLAVQNFREFGTIPLDRNSIKIRQEFRSITENRWIDNYVSEIHFPNLFNRITPRKKTAFLRHFELTHPSNSIQPNGRNPLVSGDLSVNLCSGNYRYEPCRRHLEDVSTILSKYGSHVTNFSFNFDGHEIYDTIWRPWFTNMPNLKEPILNCVSMFGRIDNILEGIPNFAAGYPFPKLRQLKKLDVSSIPIQMFNQLLLRNCRISALSVLGLDGEGSNDFLSFDLPNLKELEMEYKSVDIIERIRSPQVQWPLEEFALRYIHTNGSTVGGCGLAAVFQMIEEKFAKTLVSLFLETEVMDISVDGPVYEDCKNCRLDLPNLKEIYVFLSGSLVCLDFLLPMKNNLEEIRINFGYESSVMRQYKEKVQSETVIELVGFELNILESNIWGIFEKLKKIRVNRMKMTHEGFENRTEREYTRVQWMGTQ